MADVEIAGCTSFLREWTGNVETARTVLCSKGAERMIISCWCCISPSGADS